MNRNLVYFAIFLVLLGVSFDFYVLSLLGVLALIPAILSPNRPPMRPTTSPPRQQMRRIIPPPVPNPQPAATSEPPQMAAATPSQTTQAYPSALFPMQMFPSLSLMAAAAQPPSQPPAQKQTERDELVEVGTMLALLRLFFG